MEIFPLLNGKKADIIITCMVFVPYVFGQHNSDEYI